MVSDAKDTLAVYDLTNLVEGKPSRASSISLRTVTTSVFFLPGLQRRPCS